MRTSSRTDFAPLILLYAHTSNQNILSYVLFRSQVLWTHAHTHTLTKCTLMLCNEHLVFAWSRAVSLPSVTSKMIIWKVSSRSPWKQTPWPQCKQRTVPEEGTASFCTSCKHIPSGSLRRNMCSPKWDIEEIPLQNRKKKKTQRQEFTCNIHAHIRISGMAGGLWGVGVMAAPLSEDLKTSQMWSWLLSIPGHFPHGL